VAGPSELIHGLEVVITGWLNIRLIATKDPSGVLLWASTASARVKGYERLAIRTFGVLGLHVSIQCRVGQIGLVAELTAVVSPFDIVFAATFLLLSVILTKAVVITL